ncbi:MAG: exodeoxyribonuclease V subunit gamma [bacterium]|nr:exodeoxyribonuclease V subunit gamma [bacterium]
MPRLELYTSNRLEILTEIYALLIGDNPLPPMDREIIVVQNPGMKQWISMELARRFGVWTNGKFTYPNTIIGELFSHMLPETAEAPLFEKDIAAWSIVKHLRSCAGKPGFESLENYLKKGTGFIKLYQLSAKIASLFDTYMTFRPEMILAWEQGKEDHWQAELWRLLMKEKQLVHMPARRETFKNKAKEGTLFSPEELPSRISIFGISAFPPFHMDMFAAMSEYLDVNIFLVNPSQKYWADIQSEREIARTLRREGKGEETAEDLHLEKGNSLLASMGTLGRDFLGSILDYDPVVYTYFEEPGTGTVLHAIQSDILNVIDRGAGPGEETGKILFTPEDVKKDNSIGINSCHSPMREIEVLYNFLLDCFNSNPELKPRDILVMTPDIDAYSPLINAVFGSPEKDEKRIPFAIADRSILKESSTISTFLALLDLVGTRFGATKVLDIMECRDLLNRFSLKTGDIELIRKWVKETRICWGIDEKDRSKLGLPPLNENTWRAGLDRLLLGYAMPGKEGALFNQILSYDNIEGSESLILGRFIELFNLLTRETRALEEKRTLAHWSATLFTLLDRFFLPGDENEYEVQAIRDGLTRLTHIEEEADFKEAVDLSVVRLWLGRLLNEVPAKRQFLSGRVTFSAMVPMRSIPFKVICMIGMNDSLFPRVNKSVGFDLMAKEYRAGDRSSRNEDRYLFLESITAAREKLYISYVGQGSKDNSEIPPSVLVSELLDYISQGFEISGENILDYIHVKHRLQAFSPAYFKKGSPFYSYSAENYRGCKAALAERKDPSPFLFGSFPGTGQEVKIITIQELIQYFDNPAKYLFTKRFGIRLSKRPEVISDREPFELDGLDKYRLTQEIFERYMRGEEIDPIYEVIRSKGLLPHGKLGESMFRNLVPGIERFAGTVKSFMEGEMLEPYELNLDFKGYKLVGQVSDIWPGGQIRFRYAKGKAKDRLKAWLSHLALNAADSMKGSTYPGKSRLICRNQVWEMDPLKESSELLENLIRIYIEGLSRLQHFIPEVSLGYANVLRKENKSHEDALKKAEQIWEGSDYGPRGEREDPYYDLGFGKESPFDRDFKELSREICGPILDYQVEK